MCPHDLVHGGPLRPSLRGVSGLSTAPQRSNGSALLLEARHRPAAILPADAAGYSRVMAEDDRVALATPDAARAVFRRHIEAQGGRVTDTAGDSVLASFEAATGAE
jgi:class 3 adenylate cyclase